MRWEEDRFGYFMPEARMAVSCSDLLLSLSHFSDKTKVGVYDMIIIEKCKPITIDH